MDPSRLQQAAMDVNQSWSAFIKKLSMVNGAIPRNKNQIKDEFADLTQFSIGKHFDAFRLRMENLQNCREEKLAKKVEEDVLL